MDDLTTYLQDFTRYLDLSGKLPATIASYKTDVRLFFSYVKDRNVGNIEAGHLAAFEENIRQSDGLADNSVRRKIIAMRQFFRFLAQENVLKQSPFEHIPIPQRKDHDLSSLDPTDISALAEATQQGSSKIKCARDRSILFLFAYEGLKSAELMNILWKDILIQHPRGMLHVGGKRSRVITLERATTHTLAEFREHYKNLCAPGLLHQRFVFFGYDGRSQELTHAKITRHGLKFLLYELGESAGIPKLNGERLRHHAIDHLLERGESVEQIKGHLGLSQAGLIARHAQRYKTHTNLMQETR